MIIQCRLVKECNGAIGQKGNTAKRQEGKKKKEKKLKKI